MLPVRLGVLSILELDREGVLVSVSYRGAMLLTYLTKTLNYWD